MMSKNNCFVAILLCAVMIFSSSTGIFAVDKEVNADYSIEKVTMDATPFLIDGRSYVPVRYAATALGINVIWDASENKVLFTDSREHLLVTLVVGSYLLEKTIGGETETVMMDVFPVNINGRVYIPIRWALEPFGATVLWFSATKTASIALNGKTVEFGIGSNIAVVKKNEPALDDKAEALKTAFNKITSKTVNSDLLHQWKSKDFDLTAEEFARSIMQWLNENEDKFTPEYILQVTTKVYTYVNGKIPTKDEVVKWAEETGFPALIEIKDAILDFEKWVRDGLKQAQQNKDALKNP